MTKKKTLVFGASIKPNRYSNLAMKRLVSFGHKVVAFGVKEGIVADVQIDVELKDYNNINTITLYMNAIRQKEFYNYLISLKPKRVIFNPGTENPEFYRLLKNNNIDYLEACTLVLLATNQY